MAKVATLGEVLGEVVTTIEHLLPPGRAAELRAALGIAEVAATDVATVAADADGQPAGAGA